MTVTAVSEIRPTGVRSKHIWTRRRVLLLGLCLLLVSIWIGLRIQRASRQQQAVAAIEERGGRVYYNMGHYHSASPDDSATAKWVRNLVAHVERVSCAQMDDNTLAMLEHLTRLKSLQLRSTQVTDERMSSIGTLAQLRELDLSGTSVTDAGLAHLKQLQYLEQLTLSGTDVTGAGLAPLKGLSRLHELRLARTALMAQDRVETEIPQVVRDAVDAVFGNGVQMGDEEIPVRFRMITQTPTEAGVALLGSLTQLRTLDIADTALTDAALRHLQPLRNVEVLNIANNMRITDDGLRHLTGWTRLRHLNLSGTGISDAGLTYLNGHPRLEHLRLFDTRVSGTGFAHLDGLHELRALDLSSTGFTDAAVEYLKRFPKLEELNVSDTAVTDAEVEQLGALSGLRQLNISGTEVTDKGIAKLERRLPELVIVRVP